MPPQNFREPTQAPIPLRSPAPRELPSTSLGRGRTPLSANARGRGLVVWAKRFFLWRWRWRICMLNSEPKLYAKAATHLLLCPAGGSRQRQLGRLPCRRRPSLQLQCNVSWKAAPIHNCISRSRPGTFNLNFTAGACPVARQPQTGGSAGACYGHENTKTQGKHGGLGWAGGVGWWKLLIVCHVGKSASAVAFSSAVCAVLSCRVVPVMSDCMSSACHVVL